jgi:hypothetical protein
MTKWTSVLIGVWLLLSPAMADAAVVTRYFSTTAAGAGDGTTWADRAELDPAGVFSTVITGFAFNGTDSMLACVGPGTYTFTTGLASGAFANPPTVANPLIFHGCDGSGNLLTPDNPGWLSDVPVNWDTNLPVFATTTNIATINLATCSLRLVKFTATGATTNAVLTAAMTIDWVVVDHSGSNTAAMGVQSSVAKITNSAVSMSATSYRAAIIWSGNPILNVRAQGVTGTTGNRYGVEFSGSASAAPIVSSTIFGFGGGGIGSSSATTTHFYVVQRSVIANNGGTGAAGNGTASQTNVSVITGSMITGNGAFGIDAGAARMEAVNNRLRDNASGELTNFGNWPVTLNDTSAGDDADEYFNAAGFDFRIKNSAAIWGQGYGVSDAPAASSGFKWFSGGGH